MLYYMGFNLCSSVSVSVRVREDTDIVNGFITRVGKTRYTHIHIHYSETD